MTGGGTFEAIAIVGAGGFFPGAPTLDRFWSLVEAGGSAASEPPPGRWTIPPERAHRAGPWSPDRVLSRRACFVPEPPLDLAGLAIDPALAAALDPAVRLALHACRQAFDSCVTGPIDRSRAGVVLGCIALPTETASALAWETVGAAFEEAVLGSRRSRDGHARGGRATDPRNRHATGLPAGIVARALGLGGTTLTLDAACASSLYALKLACDELHEGRLDAVIAGGLARPDSLYTQMGFSALHALSPSGRCAPFDRGADGLVVGEGAGAVVLKRLEDALAHGDRIRGVIRGVGLSNDVEGRLLAPSSEGQLRAMRAAYAAAGLTPGDVDLVECHATGTPKGDAVELASLRALLGEGGARGRCVIGSVKSNVGHLLTGAGAAGLVKVLLALEHGVLPPTAHFDAAARGSPLEGGPLRVLSAAEPWPRRADGSPRRAAVSGFGFGGINAHVIVEEWVASSERTRGYEPPKTPKTAAVSVSPASSVVNVLGPTEPPSAAPIAIVGMATRFGPWTSLDAFERRVLGGDRGVQPAERGLALPPITPSGGRAQRVGSRRAMGGFFLEDVPVSARRFRIPPSELREMLPQQLVMLDVARSAVDDARGGRAPLDEQGERAAGLRTGVFVGLGLDLATTQFHLRWTASQRVESWGRALGIDPLDACFEPWARATLDALSPALDADRTMGALGGIVASRVARELRAGGPCFVLGSEETSGLSALESALRALRRGDVDRAVVGAVEIAGDARGLAPGLDGAPLGEGAAALVLRRLDDALRDGDRVHAVVRGAGSAVGGAAGSLAPDQATARAALERATRDAGPGPSTDAALAALAPTLGPVSIDAARDIGRAGAASGLASVVKAALCLERRVLPPREGSAEAASNGARSWLHDRADGPRRAVVSGASADGKCAAVVLEEHVGAAPRVSRARDPHEEALFALEADDRAGLARATGELTAWLATLDAPSAANATNAASGIEAKARLWFARRGLRPSCGRGLVLLARSAAELLRLAEVARAALEDGARAEATLAEALHAASAGRIIASSDPLGRAGHTAFVYPGSGNHFPGMGAEHALAFPEVLRAHDGASLRLRSQVLPGVAWDADQAAMDAAPQALLLAQVALGALLTSIARGFGITPRAAIGYSLGESTALVALGAWRDRDALLERVERSTLFTEEMAGPCRAAARAWGLPPGARADWVMGALERPAAGVRAALAGRARVYLLIVNTPAECIIGGERAAVERFVADLGAPFRPLPGVTAVHCEVAAPVAEAYRALHLLETTPPAGVRFYSGAGGEGYEPTSERAAEAVLAQALHGVDFPATIESAYRDGARIFLELGAGGSCTRMIGRILEGRPHAARALCVRGQGAHGSLLRLLGTLVAERAEVSLERLYGGEDEVRAAQAAEGEATLFPVFRAPFRAPPRPPEPRPPVTSLTTSISKHGMAEPLKPSILPLFHVSASIGTTPLLQQLAATSAARTASQDAFLRLSSGAATAVADRIAFRMSLLEQEIQHDQRPLRKPGIEESRASETSWIPSFLDSSEEPSREGASLVAPAPAPVFLDRKGCLEFATGSIARALGPAFAEIDAFPTRVRLPDEPLMLVDRIVSIDGEPLSMRPASLVTEHDVTADRWYLDQGRIPTGIAVESGQADLFLSGYLGIDRETRGLATYRLLDAVVTFHAGLPRPGDVIRYAISITELFRHGASWFFRFRFDATVAGAPLMSMREGLAGFFTAEELLAGKGVVRSRMDERPREGRRPADWRPLAPTTTGPEAIDDARLDALRGGDLAACFGAAFAGRGPARPATLPRGKLDILDRVLRLTLDGGRYGLGVIEAEAEIRPDAWFLTCHFVDDRVMPGTLMYECCMHALRVLLLRMGWIGEEGRVAVEPVPGVSSRLRCRGQVIESTRRVRYEVHVKEIGHGPEPFAIADATIHADGKAIVEITDMSARITGLSREEVEGIWEGGRRADRPSTPDALRASSAQGDRGSDEPRASGARGDRGSGAPPRYDRASIVAFAEGKPSEAFGAPYRVFDAGRRIARLPRDPYRLLDRIVSVTGEAFRFASGGVVEAEVDLETAAWTFAANRQEEISFAVLLEVALQPCGWLAAYAGSALTSDTDLHFRNLGGQAKLLRPVRGDAGTLGIRVRMTSLSKSGDSIIQRYDFAVRDARGTVYEGDTYFGFFTGAALEDQKGLRGAKLYEPAEAERRSARSLAFPADAPFPDERLRMVDRIEVLAPLGGPRGLGFIEGRKLVRADEWFFRAHFHEDPVWPGSLGLEAFLQLLRALAHERWPVASGAPAGRGVERPAPRESRPRRMGTIVPGRRHAWTYRGQVIPSDREVTVQAFVTERDDAARRLTANGFLSVDGRVIYEMQDFCVELGGGS